jgi:hypothetical protein
LRIGVDGWKNIGDEMKMPVQDLKKKDDNFIGFIQKNF